MANKEMTPEQIELFSDSSESNRRNQNRNRESINFVFTLDNCIIASIAIILLFVLAFSLGVEKGKRTNLANATTQSATQEIVQETPKKQIIPAVVSVTDKTSITEKKPTAVITTSEDKGSEQKKSTENKFTVQVASFTANSNAQSEAKKLNKDGYETFVVTKGKYTALCVGNFPDKDQAKLSLEKLKKRYQDCYIRRL